MSLNNVAMSGNIGSDAELVPTNSDNGICKFSICNNHRRLNKQTGEWEEQPMWFRCVIFGKRAESLVQYLTKGTRVALTGELRSSQYEKDGQKHTSFEIVVGEIEFMSRREDCQQGAPHPNYGPGPVARQNAIPAPPEVQGMVNSAFSKPYPGPQQQYPDVYDEDIPF